MAVLLVAAGCGGTNRGYKSARVAGTVTIDGAPVETGTINFLSEEKTGAGDDSAEIRAGKFAAEHVPVGKVRIFVIASRETGKMVPGSSEPVAETESIVPGHYVQGIEAIIAGDETDRQIALTSKP